ncbi:hypothetical protein WICANDRAFT_69774 [Wickerhamomyces anomalus NRRL Y-366-8]|uniref:Bromo domain-containing protein n=1 Tax=Wickerhamomyces anomalus (strain ATCC 58044 / CBS 1984 / NCYC 433 / NRRL Y-366-8) TaxID=683960 RepID=A0A1E3P3H0_WICAA|nr:uncharacterized protein WICANDRAFT_69774 [Wickerhamomyces anomalus NRRL Y-366-8]ODQ59427.1 hypothetical protein WICANDRAFT_69774 [Wickerhamomyces anomalus NRRL Y-366-8]
MAPKQRRKSGGATSPEQPAKRQKIAPANDKETLDFYSTTLTLVQDLREGKNQISFDFLKLPSKKLYPDYYQTIKSPISINEISIKVKTNQYPTTQDFLNDFKLMANNANEYNDPESFIAKNSLTILDFVEDQVKQFNAGSNKPTEVEQQTPKLPKIKIRAPAAPSSSSTPSTPATPSNAGLKKKYLEILQELIDFEVDGIRIGDPFLEEVSRKDFPDYYQLIKHPMALNSVRKHINGNRMRSLDQFIEEINLIWQNAQLYNEEESLIYQDSKTLQDYFQKRIEELKHELSQPKSNDHSTPSSKKKPVIKLKPPVKSKLNLQVKNEQEDRPIDEPAKDASNEEENKLETKEEEVTTEPENKQVIEPTTETKVEGQDQLETIKSTRKRSSKQTAADALIQEISIASSRSVYKQQVKNQNNNPIPAIFQNWFEYRFEANDFQMQSYTLSLPPQQGAVSVLAALNDSLTDRKHQANLTVNGERVSPIPSVQYADTGRRLTSRYELKLAVGLNMVVFDVAVDPIFNEESRLRSQDALPNVEKLTFWIQVIH